MREEFGTLVKEHEKSDPEIACHDKETQDYYNALYKDASIISEPSSTMSKHITFIEYSRGLSTFKGNINI